MEFNFSSKYGKMEGELNDDWQQFLNLFGIFWKLKAKDRDLNDIVGQYLN